MIERLSRQRLGDRALVLDAQRLARELLGDAIAANMFMLGAAWQRGLMPMSHAAIERAIELNGVAIDANKRAFEWGRRAGARSGRRRGAVAGGDPRPRAAATLDALIERRVDASARGAAAVDARAAIARSSSGCGQPSENAGLGEALTTAVARAYHRLLGVKDEWEVARLLSPRRVPGDARRANSKATTSCISTSAPGRSRGPTGNRRHDARARSAHGR